MPITHIAVFQHPLDKPRSILVDVELGRIEIPKKVWA